MISSVGEVMQKVYTRIPILPVTEGREKEKTVAKIHWAMIDFISRSFVTSAVYLSGNAVAMTLSAVIEISAKHEDTTECSASVCIPRIKVLRDISLSFTAWPTNVVTVLNVPERLKLTSNTRWMLLRFGTTRRKCSPIILMIMDITGGMYLRIDNASIL